MAKYTTRVELHKAKSDDYDELHEYMEAEGFSRTIGSADGTTYQLPTAEYNFVSAKDVTAAAINTKARKAATKTKLEFSTITTKSAGRSFYNLSEE